MLARRVGSLDPQLQAELEAVAERASAVAAPEQTPGQELATSIGNHGMGQVISRMNDGEGILPSGIAHPAWSDNSNSTGTNPNGALHQLDIYTAAVHVTR